MSKTLKVQSNGDADELKDLADARNASHRVRTANVATTMIGVGNAAPNVTSK